MLGSSINIQITAYEIATMLVTQGMPEEFTSLAVCQLSDRLDTVRNFTLKLYILKDKKTLCIVVQSN